MTHAYPEEKKVRSSNVIGLASRPALIALWALRVPLCTGYIVYLIKLGP